MSTGPAGVVKDAADTAVSATVGQQGLGLLPLSQSTVQALIIATFVLVLFLYLDMVKAEGFRSDLDAGVRSSGPGMRFMAVRGDGYGDNRAKSDRETFAGGNSTMQGPVWWPVGQIGGSHRSRSGEGEASARAQAAAGAAAAKAAHAEAAARAAAAEKGGLGAEAMGNYGRTLQSGTKDLGKKRTFDGGARLSEDALEGIVRN